MIQKHNIINKEIEREFKCTKCEKKFTQKNNMLRHLKTHPQVNEQLKDNVDDPLEVKEERREQINGDLQVIIIILYAIHHRHI